MSRKLQQFFIRKFNSRRLKNSNYKIQSNIQEARKNNELVSVGDNTVFRIIRQLRNQVFDPQELDKLQKEKHNLKKLPTTKENIKKLIVVEKDIDKILFCEDLISILVEDNRHYKSIINNGLWINGKQFVRLLAGAGNIRRNTVIFIDQDIHQQVSDILNNNRDKNIPMVDAKFSAYFALNFSSSNPISIPRILVVKDCEIKRLARVDWITESEKTDIVEETEKELTFNLFDGQGLVSPKFAFQWAQELELDYTPSTFVVRSAFLKGMLAIFSFEEFADQIAHQNMIKDIWGNIVDIHQVDAIISQSQFKLWNSYQSVDDYMEKCRQNGLGWSVSRYSPKVDKTHVHSNYQFLQVLNLSDEQIHKICQKTIDFFRYDIVDQFEYALLYLLGNYINEDFDNKWFDNIQDNLVKSIIYNNDLLHDPYVSQYILKLLNKQIRESYLGKLIFNGNYQTMVADPYTMCEHIFGLPLTGLLKEEEHYSYFWNERGVSKIAACRAPLTWRSEVNILNLKNDVDISNWYYFLKSGIIYNVFGNDNLLHADSDQDGDLVFSTDSQEFLDGAYRGNPVSYEKKEASKKIIDENELWISDTRGFNSKVGHITNISTTLMSMLPIFENNQLEKTEIIRRLKVCRLLQGREIDSGKGILKKPMPQSWTRFQKIDEKKTKGEIEKIKFENNLVVRKRPYFFRYLYPEYNYDYRKFQNRFENICQMRLGYGIKELLDKNTNEMNGEESNIFNGYNRFNPLLETGCTMNKICWIMERSVKEIKYSAKNHYFDPTLLIEDHVEVTDQKLKQMRLLWDEYKSYKRNRKENDEFDSMKQFIKYLKLKAYKISSNIRELATLAVFVVYIDNPKSNKSFAWDMFSEGILENVKSHHQNKVLIPIPDPDGETEYLGGYYSNVEMLI